MAVSIWPSLILLLPCGIITNTHAQSEVIWDNKNQPNAKPCLENTCGPDSSTCECYLTIQHNLTMMDYRTLVLPKNGQLYRFDNPTQPIMDKTSSNIITTDGVGSRTVIVINQQFPGPTIETYEGQRVIVHVRNLMHTDSTTIHWHGMVQKGTPYADGVAYVTQCPILPGHTHTYEFIANPHGTSFYHAHIGDFLFNYICIPTDNGVVYFILLRWELTSL